MVTLTGAPDWTLTVWNWAKAKVIASLEISPTGHTINDICFSPIDTTVLMAIQLMTTYFRTSEKEMRILHESHILARTFLPTAGCGLLRTMLWWVVSRVRSYFSGKASIA